ncbi:MAG: isoleucine--tRNA ligase [Candidatus Solibacter usitatus]|nr:isoleucine--tRNA ligase [Candidatus Solibacter usitatus]
MDLSSLDLKKTVNLPSTGFGMKANLPATEPKLLARWRESNLYGRIRQARQGSPRYVLHDGPPYANGNIHLGHAFNKLLKDFIIKWKTMAGYDSPYVPGWDCHGLPIEIKVDGQLGAKKAKMTTAQIRGECRKYAQKYVTLQSESFQRLGVFGRWDAPYTTMSPQYEAVIAGAFVDFLSQGAVYKGLKPVNWCLSCRTALAEAEVEYEHHSSPSIWVRFRWTGDAAALSPALAGKSVYGLIWTTTPWTIPANAGIAFHPTYEYSAVEVNGEVYIVATGLLQATAENCRWSSPREIARFEGAKLEGAVFRHPFLERDSIGVIADYVTLEQGTGAVHTAPGHGAEDYITGQKYGLPTYCPVDAHGRFYHAEGAAGRLPEQIIGKTIWEANPIVSAILRDAGALLGEKNLDHSYPHCWRCHKATIFRATEQWFIGMDQNDLRAKALEAIKQVKWRPEWGDDRMSNMIATRPDWCISRQRAWGVPITVFYCEACGETLSDRKYLDPVVNLFREHTADVWYDRTAAQLLPPDVKCVKCGAAEFRKENDILDVWFDSGSSHLAVLTAENDLPWPSDMYLEGGDQYRGWFHSSLLVGVGLRGQAPYRECATNGWALDGDGKAMSKSLGNVIEPEEIIKRYGADVLRLWTSSVAFQEDVRMSELILTRLTEAYRKLRNTFRYALGNLHDFDPGADALPAGELLEVDQWILHRTAALVEQCRAWYDELSFHRVYQAIYNFATTDLSAVYFDILKDRLYTCAPRSAARRSAQTALFRVNYALLRLTAPLLAFTADEAWSHMRLPAGAPDSVHLALMPQPAELIDGLPGDHDLLSRNWDRLMEVRAQVLKSLETARNEKLIGAPLEAKVVLEAGGGLYPLLAQYAPELPGLFITSQVELRSSSASDLGIVVLRADGVKCERCWKFTSDVGADTQLPTVCSACASAVREIIGS